MRWQEWYHTGGGKEVWALSETIWQSTHFVFVAKHKLSLLQVLPEKGVVTFHEVIAKRKAEKKAAQSQEKAFAVNLL